MVSIVIVGYVGNVFWYVCDKVRFFLVLEKVLMGVLWRVKFMGVVIVFWFM